MGDAWTWGDAWRWGDHAPVVLLFIMLGIPQMDTFATYPSYSGGFAFIFVSFIFLLVFAAPLMSVQVGSC